ncbi:hypothetical protein E2C01_012618 [Portunus trituberculatus]|uniref:Uncharacterized protein n=1 Tax=Portunus trituberculatus TaxID=210409 RepID=A0A5B7DEK6_PORTR|nr:hypothetical protein [Portunus trituberculatus]
MVRKEENVLPQHLHLTTTISSSPIISPALMRLALRKVILSSANTLDCLSLSHAIWGGTLSTTQMLEHTCFSTSSHTTYRPMNPHPGETWGEIGCVRVIGDQGKVDQSGWQKGFASPLEMTDAP